MDILNSAEEIGEFTKGMSYENFVQDEKTQRAVERELEIIGEASKRVSQELKDKHPKLLWKDMAGMRDFVIHDYPEIELKKIWKTVEEDIPQLKRQVNGILKRGF